MDTALDVFDDDAFSQGALTAAINKIDRVPGLAGLLAFGGDGNDDADHDTGEAEIEDEDAVVQGIRTTSVGIEWRNESIALIAERPRGAPAEKEGRDKSNMLRLDVPHFPLEDTIHADEVQNVRDFGTTELKSVESLVAKQLAKMNARHDLTLEHLRFGAIGGVVVGARGNVLANFCEELGLTNSDGLHAPETFDFDLDNWSASADAIRTKCHHVTRYIKRNAKTDTSKGTVVAFCGDNFFDKLLAHPSVRNVYDGRAGAEQRLGANYVNGAFEFAGIVFLNYIGTDDSTIRLDTEEARLFLSGVPGIFRQYNAPADFIETVNTPGLPRYAKLARDQRFDRHVEIHTQQNPLPVCLRPKTLVRAVSGASE